MRLSEREARTRLASVPVATLATVGDDGAPHLVPVTFAVEGDLVYTAVDHKPKTTPRLQRLRNIAGNPLVALLAQRYDDDWDALWWVRVDGPATVSTGAEDAEHAIDVLVDRYRQYRERRPEGPVITIRIEKWSGWSAS